MISAACFAVDTIDWIVDPMVLEVWFDEDAATEEVDAGRRLWWFRDLIYEVDFSLAFELVVGLVEGGAIEKGDVWEMMLCLSLNAVDINKGLFPFLNSCYWA